MCVQVTKTANRFEISSLIEKILLKQVRWCLTFVGLYKQSEFTNEIIRSCTLKDRRCNGQKTDDAMVKRQTIQWSKDRRYNGQKTDDTMVKINRTNKALHRKLTIDQPELR
jgi:hypothetical protein